ncbi:MAG TPA: DoxX family protein [Terriglobales bacterium]|nr:DoxX family protein [Terriglobales bacterium]
MLRKLLHTNNDHVLTIVRLVLGVVFLAHGAQKMLGWFGGYGFSATMAFFEHGGIPAVFAFLVIAAEFFGGIGLLLGFLTRVAAFGITCNMLVAIATLHHRFGLFMNWTGQQKGEGFEFHLLVLAITFLIMVRGAGALSLDRLLSRSPSAEADSRPLARTA